MATPKLTKLQLQILDVVWRLGPCSVREIQEAFPEAQRPAFTTMQTMVSRLERKEALRCVKRIGNANIFAAAMTREEAQRGFVDELLGMFVGGEKLLMSHLVKSGKLTMEDVKEAEKILREMEEGDDEVKG
jgi:BlaI family transcriptional regulator, penicillinase repressor